MNATVSQSTKQLRSHLIALPLLLDDLPPWVDVEQIFVGTYGEHWLRLSPKSFRRMFAGKDVKRDGFELSIKRDGIRWHTYDMDLLEESRPTAYRVPEPDDSSVLDDVPNEGSTIISNAEAREVMREQGAEVGGAR